MGIRGLSPIVLQWVTENRPDFGVDRNHRFGTCARVKRKEKLIAVIDLHIAAHARSAGLMLVINKLSEFGRVPGLLQEFSGACRVHRRLPIPLREVCRSAIGHSQRRHLWVSARLHPSRSDR
jgi:hypothetical protein